MQSLITPFEGHKNSRGLNKEHLHPTTSLVPKIQPVHTIEARVPATALGFYFFI